MAESDRVTATKKPAQELAGVQSQDSKSLCARAYAVLHYVLGSALPKSRFEPSENLGSTVVDAQIDGPAKRTIFFSNNQLLIILKLTASAREIRKVQEGREGL